MVIIIHPSDTSPLQRGVRQAATHIAGSVIIIVVIVIIFIPKVLSLGGGVFSPAKDLTFHHWPKKKEKIQTGGYRLRN